MREEEGYCDDYALTHALDHEILMHRDAHFGGDFAVMYHHYQQELMTHHPEIERERIAYLAAVEKEEKQDLAALLLTGPEAESVARARHAYSQLKNLYAEPSTETSLARIIADLVLAEEDEPEAEIAAVVTCGPPIVPLLLQILQSDEAYDPLFPGYGYAPYRALLCLRHLPDPAAVIPLFETLRRDLLFDDSVVLDALHAIGAPAQTFLLRLLKGSPITPDVIQAAYALTAFSHLEEVAIAAYEKLLDPKVQTVALLRGYLLNHCLLLRGTARYTTLLALAHDPTLPADFRAEIKNWAVH